MYIWDSNAKFIIYLHVAPDNSQSGGSLSQSHDDPSVPTTISKNNNHHYIIK